MRIKKVSGTTVLQGNVVDSLSGNSSNNAPSVRAVNEGLLDKYSLDEQVIGTWIDGKPIYRKVINIGKLQTTKGAYSYNHGISNIAYFTKVEGIINNGIEWFAANSVYRGVNNYTYDFGLLATKTKITFSTQTDRSAYFAIVTLEYTKTTDTSAQTISDEPSSDESVVSDEAISEEPTI